MPDKIDSYVQLIKNKCRCGQVVDAVKEVKHQGELILEKRIINANCSRCGLKFIHPDWRTGFGTSIIHLTKEMKPYEQQTGTQSHHGTSK